VRARIARPRGWSARLAGLQALLLATGAAWCAASPGMASQEPAADPLHSPAWSAVRERFLAGREIVFDPRVRVLAPPSAEDALNVPVMIEAQGLDVQEILVIADLNPIQKILSFTPVHALPALSFRFKVEQSTPIRAAMRTPDGVWHVGGVWLSAAGGGCTAPSGASKGLWQGRVGEMNGRVWPRSDGRSERLRLRVIHPMDTGLAGAIPAFYIDTITVRDADGLELAILHAFEPVAENPVFSVDLRTTGPLRVDGRDVQGNLFAAEIGR
jgi:sulfur-oxidizing protein SoxY